MNLSTNQISFLKDVDSSVNIDMSSGWRYHFFEGLSFYEMEKFLRDIKDDNIYLVIPLFAKSKSLSVPTLNLSEPFFIDNKSNNILITNFILDQWNGSGFSLNKEVSLSFSFKWKKSLPIWIK